MNFCGYCRCVWKHCWNACAYTRIHNWPSQSALFRSAGSLHVGRWGTRPSRGGIWSGILCPWCRSSSAACGCSDDGRPRNSSSTPSSRNMGRTSWSQPRWEVSAATDICISMTLWIHIECRHNLIQTEEEHWHFMQPDHSNLTKCMFHPRIFAYFPKLIILN